LVGLVQHRSGVQPAGLQVQRPGGLAQLVDQPAADRGRLRAALVVALVVAVAAVLVAVVHQGAGVLRGGARAAQHRADRVAGDVHRHVQAEHGLVAADQRAVAGGLDLAAVPVPVVLDDGGAALLGGRAGVAQHRADRVARDVHRHVGVDHGLVAADDRAVPGGLHGLGVVLVHDRAGVLGGRAGVAADGRDGVARHVHRNVGVGDQLVAAEDRAVARALHGVALGPALVRPLVGLVQHRSGVQPAGLQVQRPGGLAQLVDQPAADRGRLRAALVVALVVAVAAVLVAVVHQGAGVLRGGARAAQHRADRVAGDVHRHVQAEHGLVAADQRAVAGGLDLAAVPVPVVLDDGGAALLGGRTGVAQHRADRVARDVHRHVGVDHGLVAADDR